MKKIFGIALAVAAAVAAQGTLYESPSIAGHKPVRTDPSAPLELDTLLPPPAAYLNLNTTLFYDTTIVDFEKRQITFERKDSLGTILWVYHYDEMGDYLADRKNRAFYNAWMSDVFAAKGAGDTSRASNLKLAWELPVQYPGWAQRVLGNDPPRLSINGSLKIKIAYEDMNRQESSTSQAMHGGAGFVFDEQNQFTITGSVGRLININISANSEGDVDMNNPLKNFKIDYKESKQGELEDEIVQQVTAGYTGFDMPGTQLSGYSESKQGLFGIKIASKFGPLMLTSIVSHEEGESQTISVNNGKGNQSGMTLKREDQFKADRYFFLDTLYIRYYNRKWAINGGNPNTAPPPQVTGLEVWLSVDITQAAQIIKDDPSRRIANCSLDSVNGRKQKCILLVPERHYHLYQNEGYIHIFDSVAIKEDDVIGIRMQAADASLNKGFGRDSSGWIWVIRPDWSIDSMGMDPARFRLMWRNVYEIPGDVPDFSKFQLRVYHTGKDVADTIKAINNQFISNILGLTDNNGVPLTQRSDIYSSATKELIIPPWDTGQYGNEPFLNRSLAGDPKLGDLRDTMIYRYGTKSVAMTTRYQQVYTIAMSGSSKQTKFDLGLGVMENTVRVKADGTILQPNVDYVLSTEIGSLELTSPRAMAAQNVTIEYQRESLFMPESKFFLGARAEMQLPFISDKSLMGLSVLYQSTSVNQEVPRLGQEPFSKLLVDFNTKLDVQPPWMTAMVNKLPLIKTDAQSSASLEFETAFSSMNPNNTNYSEAYVDDFESSKQIYSLGESYRNWYPASPPYPYNFSDPTDTIISFHPPVWDQYWFTPVYNDKVNSIDRDSVWIPEPGRIYTGFDKVQSVLRLHVRPSPKRSDWQARYRTAWAGIMTPVPKSMAKRDRDQYFEILIKCPSGSTGQGRLHVQMGRMNEDLALSGGPRNGAANHEDTARFWTENHDKNLDRGLDTLWDQQEHWYVPNGNGGWDSLGYGTTDLKDPDGKTGDANDWTQDPSKDNNRLYDENNPGNFKYACRYQGDGWATATEDIDNNGTVDIGMTEQYHDFIIDLADTNSPYIDRTAKLVKDTLKGGKEKYPGSSWRRYRIPLHEQFNTTIRREAGNMGYDDWNDIRTVRLIWEGWDDQYLIRENQLIMCGMQFVGNQWESMRDSSGRSKLAVSGIGTNESGKYDSSLLANGVDKLIRRQRDETNIYQPENSLSLQFSGLHPGEETFAQRSFSYQPLNVSSYDSLTILVFGDTSGSAGHSGPLYNGEVKFILRFGTDTSTYYEARRTILPYWGNHICVNLKDLSDLKLAWFRQHIDPNDSLRAVSPDGTLRIRAPGGRQPNFSNITWMAVGLIREPGNPDTTSYYGEIWVDELKVVGIKRFNGWSSRLNLQTQWADFLTLSAGINYQGGDFRTMTDTRTGLGDSKLAGNFSFSTAIDKFMPREWGVSIPIGGSFTSSLSRPQLKPNTDMYLSRNNQPDGFLEMARDVISRSQNKADITGAEHFETESYGQSFFVNYSKSGTPPNPAVDLLLNRISSQFQYSMNTNHTRRGQMPSSDEDYIDFDTTRSYTGGLKYDLTPHEPPPWTKWKPLGESKATWIPQRFKDIEFSMLPGSASLDLANASYSASMMRQYEPGIDVTKESRVFDISHGMQLAYTPIRPVIDLTYSLNVTREFPSIGLLGSTGRLYNFLDSGVFGRNSQWEHYYILENERSRSQRFKITLNPQFVDWLTNSADYSADYNGSMTKWGNDSTKDYINAKVNDGVSFNSALNIGTLLGSPHDSGFGRFVKAVKTGCERIGFNNVNFTYSSTANLTNNYFGTDFLASGSRGKPYIGASDYEAYQLGMNRSLANIVYGDMDDYNDFGGMLYRAKYGDQYDLYKDDSRMVNRSIQVSTSLGITKPFDFQLSNISLRWSKQHDSYPDTTKRDESITFPEISIGARSGILEKVKFIMKYVQGMNLSSNFSFHQSRSASVASGRATGRTMDFSPLVSFDGTVKKWPVRFNYQHTMGQDGKQSLGTSAGVQPDETKTLRDGDNLELNYDLPQTSSLSTIKIYKWNIPVKGKTSMGMRFSRDHSVTTVGNQTTADNSNLSASPHLSYIFTDNVTGTLEYTGSRVTQNGSITTTNTMALIAEIKF